MKIGLSLSHCVADLTNGLMDLREVSKIVSGTAYRTEAEFEEGIKAYARSYWKGHAEAAMSIARYFWATGKLEQPRLLGLEGPNIGKGHWVEE